MRGLRRHLRALFVVFHLAAVGAASIPAPVGGNDRRAWKSPTVQAEIHAWAARLGVAPARLESGAYRFAGAWLAARKKLMAPFKPYIDVTGCDQPWRMFVAAERFPTRFQIQVHRRGARADAWETLFEERSDEHTWRRGFFEYDRVRGALLGYGWPAAKKEYERACHWLAREAFAERADVDRARCRMRRQRSPSPEEARAGVEAEVKWESVHTVDRGKSVP